MTSVPFNVGLTDNTRSSSRVLRPPGGGHTDIFGGEPEPPRTTGRRLVPNATAAGGQLGEHNWNQNQNGGDVAQNGNATPAATPEQEVKAALPAKQETVKEAKPAPQAPAAQEPQKRIPEAIDHDEPAGMEAGAGGGRQSRLFTRLLGRLRGDQHKYNNVDTSYSFASVLSCTTGCSTARLTIDDESMIGEEATTSAAEDEPSHTNIDLRYGGQYLTPEQLPEFCNQLHHLVEVIRNIQSYATVTGEYPSELERRLEREAQEVAALAAEARNARDVVARVRLQRRAVRAQRKQLTQQLAKLKETEMRELESTVRLSDRKLFKSWEALKDSTDPEVFEPLLEEIRNKQTALECLIRLIASRRATLARTPKVMHPLPPPPLPSDRQESNHGPKKRHLEATSRRNGRRRGREARSVPLSGAPSNDPSNNNVTIGPSRHRAGSAAAVALTTLELRELPSRPSVQDILFFTTR